MSSRLKVTDEHGDKLHGFFMLTLDPAGTLGL